MTATDRTEILALLREAQSVAEKVGACGLARHAAGGAAMTPRLRQTRTATRTGTRTGTRTRTGT